jgi:nucleotide-binding universal stress UspA family protein
MKSIFFQKIIWPVDVLDDPKNQKEVMYSLGALTRPTEAKIEPVYVLGPPYAQVGADVSANIEQAYYALAEKRLHELADRFDMPNMAQGKVLVNRMGTVRKDVRALLDYAKQTDADLIVVATHARRGLARMILGSFTETLVLNSTIPVVTVNPEAKARERISSILLPTTFDTHLRPSFERIVEFAKILGASLTLFYKEPDIPFKAMSLEIYRYLDAELLKKKSTAKQWQDWSNEYGVPTQLIIDQQPGHPIQAIEQLAIETNCDLIAIPTQTDPVSDAVSGSIARGIMRTAPCPVWVSKVETVPIKNSNGKEKQF